MSDVVISVSGLPFSEKAISGVSISYGFNEIPVCRLELDAPYVMEKNAAFLCNPDKYKNRNNVVTVKIKTTEGCVTFTGYFDGLSMNQDVGNISYTAIIKNKFQTLLEVYPRALGMVPESLIMFRIPEMTTLDYGSGDTDIYASLRFAASKIALKTKTPAEFVVEFAKELIKAQLNVKALLPLSADVSPLLDILDSDAYKKNAERAITVIESLDMTYIRDAQMKVSLLTSEIMEMVLKFHGSVWEMLTNVLGYLGCCIIIGNDRAWVIPHVNFLKRQTGGGTPGPGVRSTENNLAYPADYNSFSVNDNGYVNYKYCVVLPQFDATFKTSQLITDMVKRNIGVYPTKGAEDPDIPEDGAAAMLVIQAPAHLFSLADLEYRQNTETQSNLATENNTNADADPKDKEAIKKELEAQHDKAVAARKKIEVFLNAYAKLKFLQNKYSERCGSLNMIFNPRWVPGTSGALYNKLPGLFVEFFVTSVTHNIHLSHSGGSATTSVTFSSTRMASTPDSVPGAKKEEFYNYDSSMQDAVQQEWLINTTT